MKKIFCLFLFILSFCFSYAQEKYDQLLLDATATFNAQHRQEGFELVSKAIHLKPKRYDAWQLRASFYIITKEYDLALSDLREVQRLNPGGKHVFYNIGYVYDLSGDLKTAFDYYEKELALHPNNINVFVQRGFVYANQKKYPEAIEQYLKAVQLDSLNDNYFSCLGYANYTIEAYEKAVYFYSKAISLNDHDYANFYFRGLSYGLTGHTEDAKKDFERCIQLEPKNRAPYLNLATCYGELHDKLKEIEYCSYSIEQDSLYYLAYYQRGMACAELYHNDDAEMDFKKTLELKPDYYEGLFSLAEFYRKNNKTETSLFYYTKAIALRPANHYLYNARAIAEYTLGDHKSACQDWSKGIELGSKDCESNFKHLCR